MADGLSQREPYHRVGRTHCRQTHQYRINSPSTYPLGTSVNGGALLLNGVNTRPATITPGQTSTGLEGTNLNNPAMVARDKALQDILSMDSGMSLIQAASNNTKEGIRIASLINQVTAQNALTTQFPTTGLGNQLAQIARLIQMRSELGMRHNTLRRHGRLRYA